MSKRPNSIESFGKQYIIYGDVRFTNVMIMIVLIINIPYTYICKSFN